MMSYIVLIFRLIVSKKGDLIIQMFIQDCTKKEIFGSFQRSKLPSSLTDYNWELCIEEYQQGPKSEEKKYFRLTPKAGVRGSPFDILIDSITKLKSLVYLYRIQESDPDRDIESKIQIGERIQFKMQTTVIQPPKEETHLEQLQGPDSDGQIVFHQLDEKMLALNNFQLNESGEDDNDSNDSKCVEPTEGVKGDIKTVLIQYFHTEENRFSNLKRTREFLREKGHKISENGLKALLGQICKTSTPDKKTGFVLKDHLFQQEVYDKQNPKKKVKLE